MGIVSDQLRQAAVPVILAKDMGDRQRWLDERRKGIGSSDIAAIIGLSPYESPFSLWHRKFGTLGDQPDNDSMRWGRRIEDAIAQEYAYLHPDVHVTLAGMWRNLERPWQMCTPDRFIYFDQPELMPLEIKTDGWYDGWGRDGTDEIPVHYRAQVLWQLDTLGLEKAVVAVLIGGRTYREYEIHYDEQDVFELRAAALRFLALEQPPDIDDTTPTTDALRAVQPLLDDADVEIPAELAKAYERAVASSTAAEKRKILAANRIRKALGNHKRATFNGATYAIRSVYEQERIDIKRLRREHPDIAEQLSLSNTVDKLIPGKGLAK